MAVPSVDDLVAELRAVVLADDPRTSLRHQRSLLTLRYVVDLAGGEGDETPDVEALAAVVWAELIDAAGRLEEVPEREPPNDAKAALAALGALPGTQNRPFRGHKTKRGRLPELEKWLGKSPGSVTRPGDHGTMPVLDRLLRSLITELRARDTLFEVEGLRMQRRAVRRPEESRLRIDWLQQHEEWQRIAYKPARATYSLSMRLGRRSRIGTVHSAHRARWVPMCPLPRCGHSVPD